MIRLLKVSLDNGLREETIFPIGELNLREAPGASNHRPLLRNLKAVTQMRTMSLMRMRRLVMGVRSISTLLGDVAPGSLVRRCCCGSVGGTRLRGLGRIGGSAGGAALVAAFSRINFKAFCMRAEFKVVGCN